MQRSQQLASRNKEKNQFSHPPTFQCPVVLLFLFRFYPNNSTLDKDPTKNHIATHM